MTREAARIDITTERDFEQLVDELARTGTSRVITRGDKDLAVLSPLQPERKTPRRKGKTLTPAQREAFLSSFGGWKGHIDAKRFKREIKAARRDDRPPVKL